MTLEWTPASDGDPTFEVTSARQHNTLAGRSTAGAHPASALSYDNTTSGLTADTVQEAIDEVAASGGAVDSVNGETGVVVLDAADVGAVPVTAVGLLPGETNRGTWDVAATYAVGDVVYEAGGGLFVATAPSTGDQPSLTPGSWDMLDPTGRHIHLGPGATSGSAGLSIGPGATSGDYGTSIGVSATSGDFGTAVGIGATSGDYEVNVANAYRATLDPGDPTVPLTATITTGHVDLPETADVTNPPADHQRLVARTDGLYVRDETGTEVGPLGAGGGGGIPATMTPTAYAGSSAPWAATNVGTASGNGGMNVAYRMCFLPIELSARLHDVLSVVTTASGAGTSWEFGVYDLLDNMEPGAQVATLGTLDMSVTAGALQLPVAHTPARPGWWYVGIKVTAFGTAPTVRIAAQTGPAPLMPGWPSRGPGGDTFAGLLVTSGLAAGPLPAVAPTVGNVAGRATYSASPPIAYMRCA